MIIGFDQNMYPMRDAKTISTGDRLFYEIGDNRRIFKEIKNIDNIVSNAEALSKTDYFECWNFMIIKKK